MIEKQYRAFVSSLYDKYSWLEYSKMEDAVYCFHCRNFAINCKEPRFVLQGFRNWKKCYGSDLKSNKLLQHQCSLTHAESEAAYAHYQDVKSGAFQSVPTLYGHGYSKLVQNNRHYLKVVCEVLLLTAQRKLPNARQADHFVQVILMSKDLILVHLVAIFSLFLHFLQSMAQLSLRRFVWVRKMLSTPTTAYKTLFWTS